MVLRLNYLRSSLLLFAVLPVMATAQKLKRSELDKSTSQWRMESFPAVLKATGDAKLSVVVQSADTAISLQLSGSGKGTNTVDEGSQLDLLLDNDSTVVAVSPSVQSLDYGQTLATYRHNYRTSPDVLEQLATYNIRAIRKYSIGGYDDIFIDRKNAANLKETAAVFLTAWKEKHPALTAVAPPTTELAAARFPGGDAVLLSFINRNLQPLPTLQVTEQKTAVVEMTLAADGTITEMRLQQSAGIAIDDELLRILRRMPKWRPAMQNGKAVESTVAKTISIRRRDGALQAEL